MKKEIIIYHRLNDVQVAITEDGSLSELYFDNPEKERSLGNIYLGKISKILTGINAAFVDIGTKQGAFLHFSDVESPSDSSLTDGIESLEDKPKSKKSSKHPKEKAVIPTKYKINKTKEVDLTIQEGQFLLVQIMREAYSNKGVRVTTRIGIPGRYIVLFPFSKNIGISRKIVNLKEKSRLRSIARKNFPRDYGFIIRTAGENKSDAELVRDANELVELWINIQEKIKNAKEPMVLYNDMELATSVVRDHFTPDVEQLTTNSSRLHKEIIEYLQRTSPNMIDKVKLYQGKLPIFEFFGIHKEIAKIYQKKVFLKSGGYVIFDKTEAMTVVDVNSGRSKEREQEMNSFQTNSEAVVEIAKQMRLRDIGGIILIDLIDMSSEANRRRIYYEMKREIAKDKSKAVVFPLTQLCLMQITRQRMSQAVEEKISDLCPTCEGMGRIPSKFVILNRIENWVKKFRTKSDEFSVDLVVNPYIIEYLNDGEISNLTRLMMKYFLKINVKVNEQINVDEFRFYSVRQQKEITNEYL
ncbi:MAG: Rne/Rng family ribonuclease [Chloroherpetonaceae bacterium]|nr:Rne/Rng family ribonuclease [bacterium]